MKEVVIRIKQKDDVQRVIDYFSKELTSKIVFFNNTENKIDFTGKELILQNEPKDWRKNQWFDKITIEYDKSNIILSIYFSKIDEFEKKLLNFAKAYPQIKFLSYWSELKENENANYFCEFSDSENLKNCYKIIKGIIKEKIGSNIFVIWKNSASRIKEEVSSSDTTSKEVGGLELGTNKKTSFLLRISCNKLKNGKIKYHVNTDYPHFMLKTCISVTDSDLKHAIKQLKIELKNRGYEILL